MGLIIVLTPWTGLGIERVKACEELGCLLRKRGGVLGIPFCNRWRDPGRPKSSVRRQGLGGSRPVPHPRCITVCLRGSGCSPWRVCSVGTCLPPVAVAGIGVTCVTTARPRALNSRSQANCCATWCLSVSSCKMAPWARSEGPAVQMSELTGDPKLTARAGFLSQWTVSLSGHLALLRETYVHVWRCV